MRGQSLNLQNSFSLEVNNFSLEKTFNCGQTFRFFKEGNTYYYPYNDTLLEIKEVPLKIMSGWMLKPYVKKCQRMNLKIYLALAIT